jgi:FlaG/FlaF family flagellin (archaellin)
VPYSGGQICVARGKLVTATGDGFIAAPGSGATITLLDTGADQSVSAVGAAVKRVIVNLYVSHASVASGLQFDETHDNGTNWRNVISYTIAATTYTKSYVSMSAPRIRVRYVNDTNVLTAWELGVLIDGLERATQ